MHMLKVHPDPMSLAKSLKTLDLPYLVRISPMGIAAPSEKKSLTKLVPLKTSFSPPKCMHVQIVHPDPILAPKSLCLFHPK